MYINLAEGINFENSHPHQVVTSPATDNHKIMMQSERTLKERLCDHVLPLEIGNILQICEV